MKRLFFLLTTVMHSQLSFGQTDFCVPGARWMYYSPGSASPPIQNHFVYLGDTLIDGHSDVKILRKETRTAWSPEQTDYIESSSFFRQSNDSILQFVDGEFKFMYEFGLQAGDKRVVSIDWGCAEARDTMLIDSTGTMDYQGEILTTYYFSMLIDDQLDSLDGVLEAYYIGGGNGMYVERIGLMADHPTDLFLTCVDGNTIAEYAPASFVCYTDNDLVAIYPDTCNRFLSSNEVRVEDVELNIYEGSLQIQNSSNSTLHIYDILGKELFQERITSDNQTFDLNGLPNGILLVVVETETGRFTKKVVKTSY